MTMSLGFAAAIAVCGPLAIWGLASAGRKLRTAADARGIALQTVIIMVVLIVIAGGIAAALLNRGGTTVEELENQGTDILPARFQDRFACEMAGHNWAPTTSGAADENTNGTCTA